MSEEVYQQIYVLFDKVDGEFGTTMEMLPNDEMASIAFAKTVAFSNVVAEEFQMLRVASFNIKTGEVVPCPHVQIEKNQEVYERALQVLKSRDEHIKQVEAENSSN